MPRVQLYPSGHALVDKCDLAIVDGYRWYRWKGTHHEYAFANRDRNGRRKHIAMHRLILGARKGRRTDHKNMDGLDNRRSNLRLCNQSQNMANSRSRGGSSRYKGVCYRHAKGKWTAQIKINRRFKYLGIFSSEEDAARAYDAAAVDAWGEFARTNF